MTATLDSAPSGQAEAPRGEHAHVRLAVLDGWRAVSILLVLAAHMLPLGPKRFELNLSAALAGMACFFTLSGFLIVTTIFKQPVVATFLVRRLFRILPLAYLSMGVYLLIQHVSWTYYPPHYLFYVNYDHVHMTELTGVFWSLCVEVQFYALAAAILALIGLRGFILLPILGLVFTAFRIIEHTPHSIVTHLRADEIMVGATLALVWLGKLGRLGRGLARAIVAVPLPVWMALYLASTFQLDGPHQYARPYLAGMMIGRTLLAPTRSDRWLTSRLMRYVAEISYSLYVIHPVTMYGWLGSGGTMVKYLKRPIAFALLLILSHLSTFHFERRFIALGKQICRRIHPSGGERSSHAKESAVAG